MTLWWALVVLATLLLTTGCARRSSGLETWASDDVALKSQLITSQREPCPGAPLLLPTDGFIGLLYADPRGPYSRSRPHQGIDIFTDQPPGTMPVYAASDGFVTREPHWKSALIQRVPEDPLQPERSIWLYYTHMAGEDGRSFIVPLFPPGTQDLFVERGTLLGYVGNYDGNQPSRIWTHLHFSIVLDSGQGEYLNELEFSNTVDPSPYFGMDLNHATASDSRVECS